MAAKSVAEQIDPLFNPKSIAFIGASNDRRKWGNWMVERPLRTGYRGDIYPVNLKESHIQGVPAYRSILDISGPVDLAVITVPASTVAEIMQQCVDKGVKAAVLISAGFAELGEQGKALQEEALRIARSGGIRFTGPNCMGLWSAPSRLNLCFDEAPLKGGISFVTQSGTFGVFLAAMASAKGYGLNKVVSIGNQADLCAADYIEYFHQDPETKAIVLYLEGIIQGRRFFDVCRQTVKDKPIIIYKGGRTAVGARATLSHTASLAGADEIFEALCRQVGLIRAYEAMHPFDMAEALTSQPLPAGNRVAIISGGGGHCVATADACGGLGLDVPELDPDSQAQIRSLLAAHAPPPRNPVDLAGGMGTPMTIARIAEIMAQLPYIDGIITAPPMMGRGWRGRSLAMNRLALDAAEAIAAIPQKYGKPVISNAIRMDQGSVVTDVLHDSGIPSYDTPEESARAMYALIRYAQLKREVNGA